MSASMTNPIYNIASPETSHWSRPESRPRLQPAPARTAISELAEFLDSQYRLPGGIRIGWDGILGFIPGLGDLVSNFISLYIVAQAAWMGCPPSVIARMFGNLIVDNFLDAIPILGNFADFFWKANNRNVAIVESYLANPRRTTVRSRIVVGATLAGVVLFGLAFIVISIVAIFAFTRFLVDFIG
jgi:hypothetical protein